VRPVRLGGGGGGRFCNRSLACGPLPLARSPSCAHSGGMDAARGALAADKTRRSTRSPAQRGGSATRYEA